MIGLQVVSRMTPDFEYHLTIKDLPRDIRPRERLLAAGPNALSNSELLAIILGTGNRQESALNLAGRLLSPFGLRFLVEASIEELSAIKGIGEAKATQIKAALELGKRMAAGGGEARASVCSPQDAGNLVMEDMRYLDRESFRVILLDTKNHVLGIETVSLGSLNASIVHPRELFRHAIRRSAAAVILVHNHPSGDPTPSREDLEITRKIHEAGQLLGIEVLDHLVIGDNRFVSFKEKGLI
jgi:DNA repair protein RadC